MEHLLGCQLRLTPYQLEASLSLTIPAIDKNYLRIMYQSVGHGRDEMLNTRLSLEENAGSIKRAKPAHPLLSLAALPLLGRTMECDHVVESWYLNGIEMLNHDRL